jgi:predicted nucleic acid-binding protein
VIVLDTNVLSELLRPAPSEAVVAWVDARDSSELTITALTAAELRAGVALLPDGARKRTLGERVERTLSETFDGFVLPFDADCSRHFADVVAARTRSGHPISAFDAQIAAICRQHDATLATRNTADFAGTGVMLVDPWTAS